MKNKKKYFFILIAIGIGLLLLGIVFLAMYFIGGNSTADETMTRYEWMEMLGEKFGITEYSNQSPYFGDVDSGNPYFRYVQSAVEWEILEKEKHFSGEKTATGEFIVLTTMRAIGKYKIQMYLETDKEPDRSDYLDVAYSNDLITEDRLNAGFDREECLAFLDAAQNLCNQVLWKDDFAVYTYREKVVELETGDVLAYQKETGEVRADASALEGVASGDVIVFEMGNTGLKTAGKIESIDVSSGIVTVSEPSMEEIYDSLIFSDIVSFSGGDIANYYHWDNEYFAAYEDDFLSRGNRGEYKTLPMGTADGRVQDAGMAFSLASEDNKVKIKITNNNTGVSTETILPIELDDNTAIECSFEITNIDVAAQAIWNGVALEYAEVQLYTEVVEDVNLNIVSEEIVIPLGGITIPVAYGIAAVELQINLVISAEGGISIETRTPVGTHLCYEKGKNIRQIDMAYDYSEPKIEVLAEIGVMLRPEATLKILVLWDAVDIQLDVGVTAGTTTSIHTTQTCAEIFIAFPVISMEATVDPIFVAPLSQEWDIIAKEDAPFQWNRHFEVYQDGTSGFVEECTYGRSLPSIENPEEASPTQSEQEESEFAKYSTYYFPINLGIITPFEDAGDYYTIRGQLAILYAISASEFDALQEGDTFVIQDKQLVKGKLLSVEDFRNSSDYVPYTYSVYCAEDDYTYYLYLRDCRGLRPFIRSEDGSYSNLSYYCLLYSVDEASVWVEMVYNDLGEQEFKISKEAYITTLSNYDLAIGIDVYTDAESLAQYYEEIRRPWLEENAYTAEDCYVNDITIWDHTHTSGFDLRRLTSIYRYDDGQEWSYEGPFGCEITFDASGMIDSIIISDVS